MNWQALLKVGIGGTLMGAAAGAADAIAQGGATDPQQLMRTAIAGAVMGALGYWLKSPRQAADQPPPQGPHTSTPK
jgi:hypothetical protein